MTLRVIGFDPSMSNWGCALGTYDAMNGDVSIDELALIQPVVPKGKQTRQNSKDLERAQQLAAGAFGLVREYKPHAVFVEVPVGSQSARAMASYGICIGILGALRAHDVPFFEVTPLEVKLIATANKKASKQDIIDWAVDNHPNAPWPKYTHNGALQIVHSKAEHLADAVGTIYAGVQTGDFRRLQSLISPPQSKTA